MSLIIYQWYYLFIFFSIIPLNTNVKSSNNIFKISHNFAAKYHGAEREFPFSWIIKEKIEAKSHGIFRIDEGKLFFYIDVIYTVYDSDIICIV